MNEDYKIVFDFDGGLLSNEEFEKRFEIKLLFSYTVALNKYISGQFASPTISYFEIEDKKKCEKCLVSMPTQGGKITDRSLEKLHIILPYGKREFEQTSLSNVTLITHNKETNKKGIFNMETEEFYLEEKYDELKPTIDRKVIVKENDKYGIESTLDEEKIPTEYEGLVELKSEYLDVITANRIHIIALKSNGLWGVNCYLRGYIRKNNKPQLGDDIEYESICQKYLVPCVWDDIKLIAILQNDIDYCYDPLEDNNPIKEIIFEVELEGKKGLYCALSNSLLMPVVFDEIEKFDNFNPQHLEDLKNNTWYGYINGEKYMVKNGIIYKQTEINHLESENLKRVRKILFENRNNKGNI